MSINGCNDIPNSRIEKTTFRPRPKNIRRKYVRKDILRQPNKGKPPGQQRKDSFDPAPWSAEEGQLRHSETDIVDLDTHFSNPSNDQRQEEEHGKKQRPNPAVKKRQYTKQAFIDSYNWRYLIEQIIYGNWLVTKFSATA
jgi:hypothetical protein